MESHCHFAESCYLLYYYDHAQEAEPGAGFLNGQFLLAMPGMSDERFARSVVYICAHSDEGAMGFIINQLQPVQFPDLLRQIGVIGEEDLIILPDRAQHMVVRNGGPVDRTRGFVLHSDDYMVDSTMPVSDDVCLTATVDILRAIYGGGGPERALMALGYSGWAPGQLEMEVAENGWLTCDARSTCCSTATSRVNIPA